MLGEEIGLPHALDAAGLTRVETDLAEHIVQLERSTLAYHLAGAAPYARGYRGAVPRAPSYAAEQRRHPRDGGKRAAQLRAGFLGADVGVSGANFLIADSGAVCTVTNEGNAELTTTIPRVHIVTAGIEKLACRAFRTRSFCCGCWCARRPAPDISPNIRRFHCGPKRAGEPRRAGSVSHRARRQRAHRAC